MYVKYDNKLNTYLISKIKEDDEYIELLFNDNGGIIQPSAMQDIIDLEKTTKERLVKIQEAKNYLEKTRHKFESDYEPKENEDLEEIKIKRSEARKFIRANK